MAARPASRVLSRFSSGQIRSQQTRAYASKSSLADRPLYPSVEVLLHTNNLSASDIKATGPQGRLLKGDVLAHIGKINKETPEKLSQRYDKLSHLDLSNITPAAPTKPQRSKDPAPNTDGELLEDVEELALSIDLQPLLKLQKKLQDTLGQTLELSELIARAVELANRNLPAPAKTPTIDELFEDLLYGPDRGVRVQDGQFLPAVNRIPPLPALNSMASTDIFDELVSTVPSRLPALLQVQQAPPPGKGTVNDFSILITPQERQRATIFLQRMKSVLEVEPGRLVL